MVKVIAAIVKVPAAVLTGMAFKPLTDHGG
jgi:hypothetical protein